MNAKHTEHPKQTTGGVPSKAGYKSTFEVTSSGFQPNTANAKISAEDAFPLPLSLVVSSSSVASPSNDPAFDLICCISFGRMREGYVHFCVVVVVDWWRLRGISNSFARDCMIWRGVGLSTRSRKSSGTTSVIYVGTREDEEGTSALIPPSARSPMSSETSSYFRKVSIDILNGQVCGTCPSDTIFVLMVSMYVSDNERRKFNGTVNADLQPEQTSMSLSTLSQPNLAHSNGLKHATDGLYL
mmetsp:Transcript_17454/g.42430  ORF Transcript_17454/g.42430 Transcript_17454/m.42430 type:complete len:242 (+) Transcript_17454:1586-2311(+)